MLISLIFSQRAGASLTQCLGEAELAISLSPDRKRDSVTTSHTFKRDLAKYFCRRPGLTALEVGVYHGYTTRVLSAIFHKVISLDVQESSLQIAAERNSERPNVVFLTVDSLAESWTFLRNNQIDVVIIDGDHTYEYVSADIANALRHFPRLKYLVFDDVSSEPGVALAIRHFRRQGALANCGPIGWGSDGSPWSYTDHNATIVARGPEGLLCERGAQGEHIAPTFVNERYLLYEQPVTELCHKGVFRLKPDGRILTASWGMGNWHRTQVPKALLLELPEMSAKPLELFFNSDNSAFIVSIADSHQADYFGVKENLALRGVRLANRLF